MVCDYTVTTLMISTLTYSPNLKSLVHSVSLATGASTWISESLSGACSGTPVLSSDDSYIYLTHNQVSLETGTFTILDASDGSIFFQMNDDNQMLSPPGIYFNPRGGNYDGGEGKTNDLVVFGNRPVENADGVPSGCTVYAFQFPIGFIGSTTGLEVVRILNDTDFQSTTPPIITNSGNSMFWGVSRSKLNGWAGIGFDRDVGGNNIGFERGVPPSLPILAELAIGANTMTPTIYTGSAGNGFTAITTDGNEMQVLWEFNTSSPIYAQARVFSSNGVDEVIFIIEQLGTAYALYAGNGTQLWTADASISNVFGNFAMNPSGDTIYFTDAAGILNAWQVADLGASTTFAPISLTSGNTSIAPVSSPVLSSTPEDGNATVTAGNTTLSIIANSPNCETLLKLASAIGADSALGSSEFSGTVVAPYDSAFTSILNQSYIENLLGDKQWSHHIQCIINEHVFQGFVELSGSWTKGEKIMNANNSTVVLSISPPRIAGVVIDSFDNVADNGVVQFVDVVLPTPCVTNDIVALLEKSENFSILSKAITNAGIRVGLATQIPLTLFAPTDKAFESLPIDVLDFLNDPINVESLRKILFSHLARDITFLEDDGSSGVLLVATSNETLDMTFSEGVYYVNDAKIIGANILAENGIIHGIDSILIPESVILPSLAPITNSPIAPSSAAPVTDVPISIDPGSSPSPTKPGITFSPTSIGSRINYFTGFLSACMFMVAM
jgi:uncharacterized surface protein with fasciclin (FAS1) repeats/outer membrane protein assembly factor BamB